MEDGGPIEQAKEENEKPVETSKEDNVFGRIVFEELSTVLTLQHQQHVYNVEDFNGDVLESMRSEVLHWIAWIEQLAKATSIDDVSLMLETSLGRGAFVLQKHCHG